jgi:hypothetical protein
MRSMKAVVTAGATLMAAVAAMAVLPATAALAATPSPQCNARSVVQNMAIPSASGNLNCYLGAFSGDTHKTAVKVLQGAMNVCFGKSVLGNVYPLAVDGIFGNKTFTALERVQVHIGVNKDGQYGPMTRKSMRWENDDSGTPCIADGGV